MKKDPSQERWERARQQVIVRWRAILEGIEAEDEGRIAGPLNSMDEFCDEAITARDAATRGRGAAPQEGEPPPAVRCRFCLGFPDQGGCLELVQRVNRAVHLRRWNEAWALARAYLSRLETGALAERSPS